MDHSGQWPAYRYGAFRKGPVIVTDAMVKNSALNLSTYMFIKMTFM